MSFWRIRRVSLDLKDFSLLTVNCVHCDNQNSVDFNAFQKLKFVKCDNCGNMFNVFGVYKYLYDNFPLCKKMVDVSVGFGRARYNIETENAQEKAKISSFLEAYQFQEMIDRILHDMATYGDCFVQSISGKTMILQKLEPTDLEFKIDWINEPPLEVITKQLQKYKNILHLSPNMMLKPFCISRMAFLFPVSEANPYLDFGSKTGTFCVIAKKSLPFLVLKGNVMAMLDGSVTLKNQEYLEQQGYHTS